MSTTIELDMDLNLNVLKAGIAALALVCITVLLVAGSIPAAAGFGLLGTIVGYAVGNGIAAKQDVPVEPIVRRRDVVTDA